MIDFKNIDQRMVLKAAFLDLGRKSRFNVCYDIGLNGALAVAVINCAPTPIIDEAF